MIKRSTLGSLSEPSIFCVQNYTKCAEVFKENNGEGLLYICCICSEYSIDSAHFEQHYFSHLDNEESSDRINEETNQTTSLKIEIERLQPDDEENSYGFAEYTNDYDDMELTDSEESIDKCDLKKRDNDETYEDNSEIEIINIENPVEAQVKCSCCTNRRFPCFGLLKEHVSGIPDGIWQCKRTDLYCFATFRTSVEMKAHLKDHEKSDIFLCLFCAKIFDVEIELELHYGKRIIDVNTFLNEKMRAVAWQDGNDPIVQNLKPKTLPKTEKDDNIFVCDICQKTFQHYSEIKQHLKQFHGSENNPQPVYKCKICLKHFQKKKSLKLHMNSHDNAELNSINQSEERNNKSCILCKICSKQFQSRSHFARHQRVHLDKDGRYRCSVCSKLFRTKENLMQHERIHSGARPYECRVCGKRFNHSSYINIHMRTHTQEKPYKCTTCGVAFISKSKLTTHSKTHQNIRPHVCTVCDKNFRAPANLRDHFRAEHTTDKPFVCPECGKAFAKQKLLSQHMQLHTTEKQYECRFCALKFAQLAGKHGHERRMHKQELTE